MKNYLLLLIALFLFNSCDNEKGSTSFPQHNIMSECQKGSCLLFPPMWPWLHAGEKPLVEDENDIYESLI